MESNIVVKQLLMKMPQKRLTHLSWKFFLHFWSICWEMIYSFGQICREKTIFVPCPETFKLFMSLRFWERRSLIRLSKVIWNLTNYINFPWTFYCLWNGGSSKCDQNMKNFCQFHFEVEWHFCLLLKNLQNKSLREASYVSSQIVL